MRIALAMILGAAVAACGNSATAGSTAVMRDRVSPPSAAVLTVRSAAIGVGGRIAAANSAYGANRSMPVTWTVAPGAKSYAVVLEDPDASGAKPFVHWLVWNIPAGVTRLADGAPPPAGASQGANGTGANGYHGPHPPSGTHRYHLQVFALDRTLTLASGADRDALAAVMRGRVIASGEVVGLSSPPSR